MEKKARFLTASLYFAFFFQYYVSSREPRLYKRVCPSVGSLVRRSVGPSVRWSVGNAFVSAGRDEPANDLFRVDELVSFLRTSYLD